MSGPILLLGGTGEAREIARRWSGPAPLIASLAGVTTDPAPYACPVRIGGFGGIEGLVGFLRSEQVRAVVDATHPFAVTMSAHATAACEICDLSRVRFRRRRWHIPTAKHFDDWATLVAEIPVGARVLLASGRKMLAPFVARSDIHVVLRSVTRPPDLPEHISWERFVPGASEADERALLERQDITHLVTKESGGPMPGKIAAATALAVSIFVHKMPNPAPGHAVESVDAALAWMQRRAQGD